MYENDDSLCDSELYSHAAVGKIADVASNYSAHLITLYVRTTITGW